MNNDDLVSRYVLIGRYIAETGCTVRAASKIFGVSKSTVHKDVTERLRYEDPALWRLVADVLKTNKQQRHIRGGNATKLKYQNIRPH